MMMLMNNGGQSFYVDATAGDDNADGLTAATAWQTITKVNAATLNPKDRVLFKRAETWTLLAGGRLVGASGVTYADYGAGALPIIDGNGVSDCILGQEKSGITLQNLDLRNGYDACAQFITCNGVNVIDCNMQGAGNDNLIFITNNQNVLIRGGTYHDPVRRVAGTMVTNIELADGGSTFLIDDVECYGAESAGITIHNHDTPTPIPTNVTVRNSDLHDNTGNGVQVLSQGASAAPVIIIDNCTLDRNDSGIRVFKSVASAYYPQGVTLKNSTMADNLTYGFYFQADDCAIRRCVTSGTTQQNRILECKRITIYNNTIYLSPATALWPLYIMGGARVDTVTVRNNIFYMNTNSGQMVGTAASSTTNVTFDYNWYFFKSYAGNARWQNGGSTVTYANWLLAGFDAHSSPDPSGDALFTDAANGDFTLQALSPAIDAGVVIAGVTDGYLGAAPDCGYIETA
jgi:hypothetical protein